MSSRTPTRCWTKTRAEVSRAGRPRRPAAPLIHHSMQPTVTHSNTFSFLAWAIAKLYSYGQTENRDVDHVSTPYRCRTELPESQTFFWAPKIFHDPPDLAITNFTTHAVLRTDYGDLQSLVRVFISRGLSNKKSRLQVDDYTLGNLQHSPQLKLVTSYVSASASGSSYRSYPGATLALAKQFSACRSCTVLRRSTHAGYQF